MECYVLIVQAWLESTSSLLLLKTSIPSPRPCQVQMFFLGFLQATSSHRNWSNPWQQTQLCLHLPTQILKSPMKLPLQHAKMWSWLLGDQTIPIKWIMYWDSPIFLEAPWMCALPQLTKRWSLPQQKQLPSLPKNPFQKLSPKPMERAI